METRFKIPRTRIFSSRDDSFVSEVLQSTDSRGVDVVVNNLSGDLFVESWKCVVEGGSMIDLSMWDSSSHDKFPRGLLGKNRSYHSLDMVATLQQKPSMAKRFVQTKRIPLRQALT